MKNLNDQLSALLTAIESAPNQNPLFDPAFFDLAVLKSNANAIKLTAEELAIAAPTLERLHLEKVIDEFVLACLGVHFLTARTREIPAWLVMSGTTEENFAQFEAGLAAADAKLLESLKNNTGRDKFWFDQVYQQWQEKRAQETLKAEAQTKVNHAVDLLFCLKGICRVLGMTGSEIEQKLEG